ncbi:hypothetical protein LJR231_004565 [Phyllobacterium sp. LjRoot231]|uniref:hypothetical protein n=1 Tax=Phyllobacterium sp. LjRoot231 TaxID=3342289 RepID=UPI003ECE2675
MRNRLQTFCPSKTVHSRIVNALWIEFGGTPWNMPPDWEPERAWARQLDLTLIPNLGPMSVAILDQWLAAGDDNDDGDGGAERPGEAE